MALQHTIKAVIRPGEQSGFIAECVEIPVVTEGATLDEVAANLREAVALHLKGEDLTALGFAPQPSIVVTFELEASPACRVILRQASRFVPVSELGPILIR